LCGASVDFRGCIAHSLRRFQGRTDLSWHVVSEYETTRYVDVRSPDFERGGGMWHERTRDDGLQQWTDGWWLQREHRKRLEGPKESGWRDHHGHEQGRSGEEQKRKGRI
jgi:hypothetical protein